MAEIILTEENFKKEVSESSLPVLVDFWASWCGPCRMLSPVVAEIARENEGKIKVGKVNVDDAPGLAAAFQIASIPTLLFFKNGKVVSSSVGYRPKEEIEQMLR